MLQQVADGIARGCAARFAGQDRVVPALAQPRGEQFDLGRFSAAFGTFECDK
jgi:hypothetical protein